MNRHVRSSGGGGGDGDWPQGPHWACPFYLSNPIRHATCMAYKLRRVPDVRQHIERKHAEEAGEGEVEKMKSKSKNDRATTNVERWYALWTLFFPGQARPATPYYTGTEFADLSVAFASRFLEEWEKNGMSGDAKTALTGYVAFVKSMSLEMKSGRMSIQAIAHVSEHQPQSAGIHSNTEGGNTYKRFPLLPNPLSPMIMGQPQQVEPQGVFPGYYDTHMPNVPTQAQAPSMPVANSQYWPRSAGPAAYSALPAHQLPPVQSMYDVAANGIVDYTIGSPNLPDAMNWASEGDLEYGGGDRDSVSDTRARLPQNDYAF